MRRCSGCHERKPEDAFARDRTRPTGRQAYCRECSKAAMRRFRERQKAEAQTARAGGR